MNLTLHIVRKDVVRMRAWIVCWVGVLLLPIGFGARLLGESPFGQEWNLPNIIEALTGLQAAVGFFLTILLIHEDGVVGTKQFWLTRPISRKRLLGAKMLSVLVVIGLIPVLVMVPWWMWCGFGIGGAVRTAFETIWLMMLIAVPAAFIAVLTDSFARAVLWSLVLVTGILFAAVFLVVVKISRAHDMSGAALVVSRSVVAVIAVAVLMAAVVVVQFLIRRRGWWLGVAGALMAVSLAVASWLPWPWLTAVPKTHHEEQAADLTAQFASANAWPISQEMIRDSGNELFQRLNVYFEVTGIPADARVNTMGAKHRWSWPDGAAIVRSGYDQDALSWWTRIEAARAVARSSVWIQPSMVARMRSSPPAYETRLWWQVVRPKEHFAIPLAPSAWKKWESRGIRIDSVRHGAEELTTVMVQTRPARLGWWLRHVSSRAGGNNWFHGIREEYVIVLTNGRGEVFESYVAMSDHGDKPRVAVVNGVEIWWRERVTAAPKVFVDRKWVVRPGWADEGRLRVETLTEHAVVSRDVKVQRFELEPERTR